MKYRKRVNFRIVVLSLILVLITVAYSGRLFKIQVSNRNYYLKQAEGVSSEKSIIKAARGEILDCYGRPVAINKDAYNIVFNKAYLEEDKINDTILFLTDYLYKNDKEWIDELPFKKGKVSFSKNKDKVSDVKDFLKLNSYATAKNCFDSFVKKYELEGYSKAEQLRLMGVRYSMDKSDFSITYPYTFAEDIGDENMVYLYELAGKYPGVEITSAPVRKYVSNEFATHIIGNVGPIQSEDWKEYKKKGYSINDKVGISGIEYAFEDYLHGTDGEITYKFDSDGNIISSEVTKKAVAGNTIILSLDKTMQLTTQKALKDSVESLQQYVAGVTGGAVVISNVKTGNIIAAANYPSYTVNDYNKHYDELIEEDNSPLLNRAFMGVYPPGSSFKPAVASIGLYLGKISSNEFIYCKHKYDYYKDYKPTCMGYHGATELKTALAVSCNYFFFELGRRIGITDLNKYCKKLGLGVKTGIEVPESEGILAGREYSESIGNLWTDGLTLQAAIGQGDNMFSPLQLCMYTTAIVNNGTRYKASLLKKVVNYSLTQTVYDNEPKVLNKLDFGESIFSTVKEGMHSVTTDGTGAEVFKDFKIQVGGKSGTAENYAGDHVLFVAFAPYDEPEIALSVVIEHGQKSHASTSLVRTILNSYFLKKYEKESDISYNKILK